MLCPRCNSENELGAKFCKFCNAQLDGEYKPELDAKKPKKSFKSIFSKNIKVKSKNPKKEKVSNINSKPSSILKSNSDKIFRRNQIGGLFSLVKSLVILAIILLVAFFLGKFILIKIYSSLEYYKVNRDKVPSISYVTSNQNLDNISWKIANHTIQNIYHYKSKSVSDDLIKYLSYLLSEENYQLLSEFSPQNSDGNVKLAAKSENSFDDVIVIDISWKEDNYSIYLYNDRNALNNNTN